MTCRCYCSNLHTIQQYSLETQKSADLVDCNSNTLASRWKDDYSPTFSTCENASGVPQPVLDFPILQDLVYKSSPVEDTTYKLKQEALAMTCFRVGWERCYSSVHLPVGRMQFSQSCLIGVHGWEKRQQFGSLKAVIRYTENIYITRVVNHQKKVAKRCLQLPPLKRFKTWLSTALRNLTVLRSELTWQPLKVSCHLNYSEKKIKLELKAEANICLLG